MKFIIKTDAPFAPYLSSLTGTDLHKLVARVDAAKKKKNKYSDFNTMLYLVDTRYYGDSAVITHQLVNGTTFTTEINPA